MISRLKSLTSVYFAVPTLTFLLYSLPAFAQKTLPLDNSTCNPAGQLNCLWNDHLGCFIRATKISANQGTCAPSTRPAEPEYRKFRPTERRSQPPDVEGRLPSMIYVTP